MVTSSYLHDHRLASSGSAGKCQLVALTASVWSAESGKAISQIVVDRNRLII
jgi:hypothetical protein